MRRLRRHACGGRVFAWAGLSLLCMGLSVTIAAPAVHVDVQRLALELAVDWQKSQVHGTAVIHLTVREPAERIALTASQLAVDSVTSLDGQPLEFKQSPDDVAEGLTIGLGRRYRRGESAGLRIVYHSGRINESDPNNLGGSNGKGLRFFQPTFTEPMKRRQLWSMGEPDGNRYWFPDAHSPGDLRSTDIAVTVPKPLSVVATGELLDVRDNGDGTRRFHWRNATPHPSHMTALAVGEYVDIQQPQDRLILHSFGYPDEADAIRATVVRLPDMVNFFERLTASRYPFGHYSQVFVQDLPWGTGSHGLSILTENMIDDERTHADYFYLWDGLEAEALANQWFGGLVAPRDWRHAWLKKGFAHYLDALYDESRNGRSNFLLWKLLADQNTYLGDWKSGIRHAIVPEKTDKATEYAADNYPYARGALVLHMLRKELGESVWHKALQAYVRNNAGRTVTSADFERAVERASGRSLRWFFQQWIYGAGHPMFSVRHQFDAATGLVTLFVRQTQTRDRDAAYPQTEFFQGHVDVAIDGALHRVWLRPAADNVFRFASPTRPRLVGFDYESTWIKELSFDKPVDEWLYQAIHDKDVLGQRAAIAELVRIAQLPDTSAVTRNSVLDMLRQIIAGNAYWRIKYSAILQLNSLLAPVGTTAMLDDATGALLASAARTENPWVRSVAINFLGQTRDAKYAPLYDAALLDKSHVVNFAAAIAIGRARMPGAFETLAGYRKAPSWKGENLLCSLAGLRELGDPRGAEIAYEALADSQSHRWTLAVSRWDFRIAGAETLVALGQQGRAYGLLDERFRKSLQEGDVNDIFSNVLLMATLGDARSEWIFPALRQRFSGDANALTAIDAYEAQYRAAVKKN